MDHTIQECSACQDHALGIYTFSKGRGNTDNFVFLDQNPCNISLSDFKIRRVSEIRLSCAWVCQAIDLRAPLVSSDPLMRVHARVRAEVPTLADDRPPAPDIAAISDLVDAGALDHACGVVVNLFRIAESI